MAKILFNCEKIKHTKTIHDYQFYCHMVKIIYQIKAKVFVWLFKNKNYGIIKILCEIIIFRKKTLNLTTKTAN